MTFLVLDKTNTGVMICFHCHTMATAVWTLIALVDVYCHCNCLYLT